MQSDPASPRANSDSLDRIKIILRRDLRLGPDVLIPDNMPLLGGEADLDSLDVLLLLTSLEKEFGVKVPSEVLGDNVFLNVSTLAVFVDERRALTAASSPGAAPSAPADQLSRLPHAAPFRFVTRLIEVKDGESGVGIWVVSGNEAFFAGHFPGKPLVPGVLIAEALAQLSGIVGAASGGGQPVHLEGKLAHVDVRFDEAVVPPAEIRLESRLMRTIGPLQQFDVLASVAGNPVARGSVALARSTAVTARDFVPPAR